ncbi:MAG: phage portal protein [Gammaproteobacteria bacterium]|nr:phage portal protein [Gammaproteobacteria bacterium]
MALFDYLEYRRARRELMDSLENPATPLTVESAEGWTLDGGGEITEKIALSIPGVWAAVDFLSSSLAGLPLKVYKKSGDDRKESKGPYFRLLNQAPNPTQTAFDLRKYLWERTFLYGRGFAIIKRRDNSRMPVSIWIPDPATMKVERIGGEIKYTLYDQRIEKGFGKPYEAEDVIDIPWMLMPDGIMHYRPLSRLAGILKRGVGAINYMDRAYGKGGMADFVLTGPFTNQAGMKRAIRDFERALVSMIVKGTRTVAVPNQHDVKPISRTPQEMQAVENERVVVEQVGRFYGIPPTVLQDWRKSTYRNMEQGDLHVVKHTLTKWAIRLEQQFNLKLWGMASDKMFAEHSMAAISRGDLKSRTDAYARMIQTAQKTPNEVRKLENDPPMPGGDQLLIQGATVPLKDAGKKAEKPPMPEPNPDDDEGDEDDD